MKNIRTKITEELEKLDLKWRRLPLKTQCRYVIMLFAFYLVTGIGVLVKVCYDLGREDAHMAIQHIESPGIQKKGNQGDSASSNIKSNLHGRER
ncbi:nitrogen regulatory IIA protein [Chryseobacterium culicis]|uniref:nitrogen regulatory IIA protein n=1 Tax=Chryseobacterium culicis TaxID=680127 RepID=UPI002899DCE4|nr:nitrogen regulatory IIA protein [Chryseobacterium culicis]